MTLRIRMILRSRALTAAVALGLWSVATLSTHAGGGFFSGIRAAQRSQPTVACAPQTSTAGTLGYGPSGVHPGFQGFGLGYDPGYGYGGSALGVGAGGGYPIYAGPGYHHPAPSLRRFGPLVPFVFNGGPGYPTPENPNFYGPVGPLISDQPVVTVGDPSGSGYASGFGCFTGRLPYAESVFAPYTDRAAVEGTSSGVATPTPLPANIPSQPSTIIPPGT